MKLLHLSDLHFGKSLFEFSLIEDQRFWADELIKAAASEKYDCVVIAGDLFDRAVPSAEAVSLLDRFIYTLTHDLDLPVLAISGNHDSPERLSFCSRLYRSSGFYMAAIPSKEIERITLTDEFGEIDFYLIPYISVADGKNLFPDKEIKTCSDAYRELIAANEDRIDYSRRCVVVAHGFFAAGSSPEDIVTCDSEINVGGSFLVDANIFSNFDYGAFGHIHSSQSCGLAHLRYCGSPLKYSVSEHSSRKAPLSVNIGVKGNGITCCPLSTPILRDLRTVTGSAEELISPSAEHSEDYVFIQVLTDKPLPGFSERIRNIYPNYLGIKYIRSSAVSDIPEIGAAMKRLSVEDAFSNFYSYVTGRSPDENELKIISRTAINVNKGEGEK